MSNEGPSPDSDIGELDATEQRRVVRERYGDVATSSSAACCEDTPSSCCSDADTSPDAVESQSLKMGYSEVDLETVPEEANLGLGCGNPTAIASLQRGDTVVDLGSGAGFDCFLAAEAVGADGHVIGVDMTHEMIEKARENAAERDASQVEFRLGEIEHLPVADASVDVVISNCVVNLSPDKPQVFRDAFRVLQPGGRLAISDIVSTAELPESIRSDPTALAACVAGASSIDRLETMLDDVGFADVSIQPKTDSDSFIREWDDERDLSEYLVSARIEARKPTH